MTVNDTLAPGRHAHLLGRARLTHAVSVPRLRDITAFADAVTGRLTELLERRFGGIDHNALRDIVDATLSRMIRVDPDSPARLVGDTDDASLAFAEVVYTVVRAAHHGNAKLIAEWGFSGFHPWFAVIAAEELDRLTT